VGKPKGAGRSSFELIDADRVLRELNLQEETVVLDVGSGYGAYSIALASRCPRCKIIALDLWQEGMKILKSDSAEKDLRWVMPLIGDAGRAIPLKDGSADVCLTATVLHDLAEEGNDELEMMVVAHGFQLVKSFDVGPYNYLSFFK